jgi:ubiquitin C-terminal hydrolase
MNQFRFNNRGNNCYLNSVLQILLNNGYFELVFEKFSFQNMIFDLLKKVYCARQTGQLPIDSGVIKTVLAHFDTDANRLFGNNNQQDAHEAIVKILDIVHMSCKYTGVMGYSDTIPAMSEPEVITALNKDTEKFGSSFITKFYSGQFKTIINCKNCDYKNVVYESFNNISISITSDSVVKCFRDFMNPEVIDDFVCEKCKSRNSIHKRTVLSRFPHVLILCIKRFSLGKKIKDIIKIDKNLKIKINTPVDSSASTSHIIEYNYEMSGLVHHTGGSIESGHYSADILISGEWYSVDDEFCRKVSEPPMYSKDCYIVVYNRIMV